nr:hypothetical protein [Tanacetum cinerariifolium]
MQTQTSNALHNAIMEAGSKDRPPMLAPGIDNDIYSTVDACQNACEMWKAIKRLKQGESINVHDFETNLYWEFGKFTSRDGESLESYYSRFYKMMNEFVRNKFAKDDEMSKDKEIDKLMALISLSVKKIYKPANNILQTSSNTSRANQDNSLRFSKGTGYDNQRTVNVAGARENVGTPAVQKFRIQCYNCKEYGHVARECQKPKWAKGATYYKEKMLLYQELEAHYMYMEKLQEVTPDAAHNSGPIFDTEPVQQIDQNDDDDLDNERELLASLIEKLKSEIYDSKNRNKFLETSNQTLVDKLKGEIEDFKTKNKSLESSNNHFKEANNELSKTNKMMYNDIKMFQAELYRQIKKELFAHQETISILTQQKEAQIKLYKSRKDKEIDKVIALENKVKVLDNIVYKTGQSVQTINMLNRNCKTSFVKPEFLKKEEMVDDLRYFNSLELEVDSLGSQLETQKTQFLNEIDRLSREYYYADQMNAILEEMIDDLRYFNSLELEVDSLGSQLETQKTQFLNEIDRLSREYYYADQMNAILGVYTELDEVTNCNDDTDDESDDQELEAHYMYMAKLQQVSPDVVDFGRIFDTKPEQKEEAGIQLNAEQADWKDDTDDESDDQELEAHYMYMAKVQEVSPDAVDSGPIFDTDPEQKVQNNDHYDVFAIECQHPEQSESVHETYPIEQDAHNVIIESMDMNYNSEQIDQNEEDADLSKERELLAYLIEKLKCEIDESKNRNKFLETSNKVLIDKLKSEIKDFKNKNNSLELSNNQFKEANNKLSKENDLLYTDFKKSQAALK